MGKNVLKTIATGDMFITRRIAKDGYELNIKQKG